MTFLSQGDSLPLAFHLAAAYEPARPCTLVLEGVQPKDGHGSVRAGAEWRPLEVIALRVGYRTDALKELDALAGFSTGIGLSFWGQEFSYAWVPYGDLGDTQYFSLLVRFGQAQKEKKNLIHYQTIKAHRMAQNPAKNDVEYDQLMQLFEDQKELVAVAQARASEIQP